NDAYEAMRANGPRPNDAQRMRWTVTPGMGESPEVDSPAYDAAAQITLTRWPWKASSRATSARSCPVGAGSGAKNWLMSVKSMLDCQACWAMRSGGRTVPFRMCALTSIQKGANLADHHAHAALYFGRHRSRDHRARRDDWRAPEQREHESSVFRTAQ